jgi:predicted nucleic acid-binding protein
LNAATRWVVDASTLIAWLLEEERPTWVEAAIDEVRAGRAALHAPSLLWLELGNRLCRAIGLSDEFALEAMLQTEALEIEDVQQSRPLRLRAVTLARSHGLSMYDATYLAAAEAVGCPLLTLDARLDRAATSMGLGREGGPARVSRVSEPARSDGDRPVDTASMASIGAALAGMRREYAD